MTPAAAARLFPELAGATFTHVHHIVDLDAEGLDRFADGSFDFVIASHVIEHLANPVRLVVDAWRTLAPGGILLIAAPDKRFTFDAPRAITPWEHVAADFASGVRTNDDDHYWDFLRHVAPHVFEDPARDPRHDLARVRARREHAHVWDSAAFQDFLHRSFALAGARAERLLHADGEATRLEDFSAWRKPHAGSPPPHAPPDSH